MDDAKRDALTAVRYGHDDSWEAVERYIESIVEPLESRLEALQEAVHGEANELHNLVGRLSRRTDDQFSQDMARAVLKRVARLRELSGQPGEAS